MVVYPCMIKNNKLETLKMLGKCYKHNVNEINNYELLKYDKSVNSTNNIYAIKYRALQEAIDYVNKEMVFIEKKFGTKMKNIIYRNIVQGESISNITDEGYGKTTLYEQLKEFKLAYEQQ